LLPKINRITKKRDFDVIFKKGAGFKEGSLLLKITAGASDKSRFAFIIGKKVSGKATLRNKIRRQLRKLTADSMGDIKKKIDAVFVVLPGFKDEDFLGLKNKFEKLFKKAKIIQ
jgi:ribonuclease P protein component